MNKKRYILGIKLGLLFLVISGAGIAASYFLDDTAVVYQNFINDLAKQASNQVGQVAFTDKKEDKKMAIAYFPIDDKGQEIEILSKPMRALFAQKIGDKALNVYQYNVEKVLPNVKAYQLYQVGYDFSGGRYRKSVEKVFATLYQNEHGEFLNLKSFLESSLDVDDVAKLIKEGINESTLSQQDKEQLLKQIDVQGIEPLTYVYTKAALSLFYQRENGQVNLVELSAQKIVPYFKEGFVLDTYKEHYQANVVAIREKREKTRVEKLAQIVQKINARTPSQKIALTFDDGPSEQTTPQVLDILKQHGIKATFYIVGSKVQGNEAILKRIVDEGHELGNHSWNHPDLTTLSMEEAKAQIENTQRAIEQVTGGIKAKSLRPPYGAINATLDKQFDLPLAMWNVDSLDWQSHSAEKIINVVSHTVSAGGIILTHDIHQDTVDALHRLIVSLKEKGYEFATFSEMFQPEELVGGIMYFGANDTRLLGQ